MGNFVLLNKKTKEIDFFEDLSGAKAEWHKSKDPDNCFVAIIQEMTSKMTCPLCGCELKYHKGRIGASMGSYRPSVTCRCGFYFTGEKEYCVPSGTSTFEAEARHHLGIKKMMESNFRKKE